MPGSEDPYRAPGETSTPDPTDGDRRGLAYVLLIVTMTIWASAFPGIKFVLRQIDPYALAMLRLAFASAGLGIAAWWMSAPLPDTEDLPALLATGFLGFAVYHSLLNFGLSFDDVSAGQGSFIISTIPIWTTLLAWQFLHEVITVRTWLALALGLGGVGVISLDPDTLSLSVGSPIIICAAMSAAANIVLQKQLLEKYSAIHVSIYATIFGTIPLLAYLPVSISDIAALNASGWAVVAYLGLVPIALGYFLNAVSLSILPANRSSQFLLLVPPIATLIAWLTLGETPSTQLYFGGPMILAGVLLGQLERQT
jgi:drug/metabolite transporter (DMT)-like permease